MPVESSQKSCVLCRKDVSNAKRVKDAKGQYYCQACYEKAAAKKGSPPVVHAHVKSAGGGGGSAAGGAGGSGVRPSGAAPRPIVTAPLAEMELAPEKPEAKKIPEFCPNCGTKVFPGRKLCVKCNRDVTRMDKLLAIQAEAAKGPSKEEKIASMVSRVVKAGLILFVIGFVIFGAWGLKLMFTPAKPWDDFPTTRAGAVKEWLTAIAEGTPKSYDRAFMLVSQRVRMASNANEETFHKVADKTIHDEFQKKYGAGWISKVEFVKSEYPLEDAEEMVEFRIGEDTYHVGTQVQQAMDQMVMNLAARQRLKYGEDGTYHFGVTECLEFPAHPPEIDRSGPPPNYGGTGAPVY